MKKKITKFPSGAVRDTQDGKESYIEPFSWIALRRYAFYMKVASQKYGEDNWRKGIPTKSYENSLMRHLQKYLAGKYDKVLIEPEIDHLSAALFNLLGIIHNEEQDKLKK